VGIGEETVWRMKRETKVEDNNENRMVVHWVSMGDGKGVFKDRQ